MSTKYQLLVEDPGEFRRQLVCLSDPVPVVFATQTQTCRELAAQVVRYLSLGGVKAQTIDVKDFRQEHCKAPLLIYLTCTFFIGDHPRAATNFVRELKAKQWTVLRGKYFAVFGIGSLKYKLFCKASAEIDHLLEQNGGVRMMAASQVDRNAPQGYEPQFQEWLKDLLDNCGITKIDDSQAIYATKVQSRYPYISPPKGYKWIRLVERRQLSDQIIDGVQHYYKF